ncbi:hypothetical protein L0F63_003337, partial [Massospora cicadina]
MIHSVGSHGEMLQFAAGTQCRSAYLGSIGMIEDKLGGMILNPIYSRIGVNIGYDSEPDEINFKIPTLFVQNLFNTVCYLFRSGGEAINEDTYSGFTELVSIAGLV